MPVPGASPLSELIVQSDDALHRGQELCSRAEELHVTSASYAVDAQALDAKVKFMTTGVLEQLKMATDIAKALVVKRGKTQEEIKHFDILRDEATEILDSQLDQLRAIIVPRVIYDVPKTDEPFGGCSFSDPAIKQEEEEVRLEEEKQDVLRSSNGGSSKPKNLRDFVDETEVEEVLKKIDEDRAELEEILNTPNITAPTSLVRSIAHMRATFPPRPPSISGQVHSLLSQQDETTSNMVIHLESLTRHAENLRLAQANDEHGLRLEEDDLEMFTRDTQELAPTLEELEQAVEAMESLHDQMKVVSESLRDALSPVEAVFSSLDTVWQSMDAVSTHLNMADEAVAQTLPLLNAHLSMVNSLEGHFKQVELAYHALVLELDRRRAARSRAEAIVQEMQTKLDAWRMEETEHRTFFKSETLEWLPKELCPTMAKPPAEWTAQTVGGEADVRLEEAVVAMSRRELGMA